jgi:hypothetical protein
MRRRRLLGLSRFPVFATLVLLLAIVALPGRVEVAVHLYVLALAAFGLGLLLRLLRVSLPEPRKSVVDPALAPRRRAAPRIPELERIEREVTLGQSTAFDLHFRLRPTLRRIASELLRSRRGIDLDREPEAARRALGDETWHLVRPDREPPSERFGRGIELASLRDVVASLERI